MEITRPNLALPSQQTSTLSKRSAEVRATPTQENLWLFEKLQNQSQPVYNEAIAFQISGLLDVEALSEAIKQTVNRHEALRSTFREATGGLQIFVSDELTEIIDIVDLRTCSSHVAKKRADDTVLRFSQQIFDLTNGPLFRALIVRTSEINQIVCLVAHHVVIDGWSFSLIVRDIGDIYRESSTNPNYNKSTSKEAPRFSDYANQLKNNLEHGVFDEQMEFWTRQLQGAEKLLELPLDRPRPAVQKYEGADFTASISKLRIGRLLSRCSRECGATSFVVFLAAYASLLKRYTGQTSITIGTTTFNRTDVEHLNTVGCFVNTGAIPLTIPKGTTFKQLLTQLTEFSIAMLDNQEAPYPKIIKQIAAERNPGFNPIFQTMMTALGPRKHLLLGDNLDCQTYHVTRTTSKFDVLIYLTEDDDSFQLQAEFNTSILDPSTIERMLNQLVHMLESLEDLDVDIACLSILPQEERRQLLDAFNNTFVPLPNTSVVEMFETQAKRMPNAIAVEFRDQTLTYAQLDQLTNQLARAIRTCQITPDGFVGVYMERSLDMVISLLAVMKAGLAYVPIDPEHPPARVQYMVEDANVPFILTQEEHRTALTGMGMEAFTLVDFKLNQYPNTKLEVPFSAGTRAYMIYTSGSTGKPKGVINCHQALFNRLLWMQDKYKLDSHDRVLQKTPYGFDVSVWEFFWPLMYGARIVVAEPGGHRDPTYLSTTIREKQITALHFVPSMLSVFVEQGELARDCASLRHVFCSGEALPYKTVAQFYAHLTCPLHNLYGPTEAAIDVSHWTCTLDYPKNIVPIGKPVPNTQLLVLDELLQLQPINVPGELCIGGIQLAEGYHNLVERTAQSFVSNPFSDVFGGRLYRTGDLARYLPDGNLEYLGRLDNQVKLRGFRIELGEIEAVIRDISGVKDAAVIVHGTSEASTLTAYVVAHNFDLALLRRRLQEHLPDYMIPAHFVELSSIPLNANGKLDRKALPTPATSNTEHSVNSRSPTATEQQIINIWQDILHVHQVNVDSNFFRLGGDSIQGIRVASRLRELGYSIELHGIFQYPVICDLARYLDAVRGEPGSNVDVDNLQHQPFALLTASQKSMVTNEIEDAWPATILQTGMIYHSMLREASPVYHDIFSYRFSGIVNLDKLTQAIHSVVNNHSQLRSTFDMTNFDQTLQLIHKRGEARITFEDLSSVSQELQHAAHAEWVGKEKESSFDFEAKSLFRCHVQKYSDTVFSLNLSFHHAILDGWSVALIVDGIRQSYANLINGLSIGLSESRISYSVYVSLEQKCVHSPDSINFWLGVANSIHYEPYFQSRFLDQTHSEAISQKYEQYFQPTTIEGLSKIAEKLGIPLKNVFLAIHIVVLSQLEQLSAITTGVVVNGRPEIVGGDSMVGLFLNTVPFSVTVNTETWESLFTRVFEHEQSLLPHRRYPYSEILKQSGQQHLFNTIFNFTDFHVYASEDQTVMIDGADYFEQTSLDVVTHIHRDRFSSQMQLLINYDSSRIDETKIAQYGQRFVEVAAEVAANPSTKIEQNATNTYREKIDFTQRGDVLALETQILEITKQVLGLIHLDADADLIKIGLNSITAIRLVARIKQLGVKVGIHDIFDNSSVQKIATYVFTQSDKLVIVKSVQPFELANGDSDTFGSGVVDAYPITSLQLEMIKQHQLDLTQAVYHDVFSYHLNLTLDVACFSEVLQGFINTHENLRTSIKLEPVDRPYQLVMKSASPVIEVSDLSSMPSGEQDRVFKAWFEKEKDRGFDFADPPLIRFFVHRRDKDSFILTLSFHHAIIDGWSLSLLIKDLINAYQSALVTGQITQPSGSPVKYCDYVSLERESQHDMTARSFWVNELRGYNFPTLTQPSTSESNARWSESKILVDCEKHAALKTLSDQLGVTLKHTLLAAHLSVLTHLHQQSDVMTYMFTNGRLEQEGGDDTLGMFLNFVPLRQDLNGHTWRTLINQIKTGDYRLLPYRRYSYSNIKHAAGSRQEGETAFNYTHFDAYYDISHNNTNSSGVITKVDWFEHTHFNILANFGHGIDNQELILTLSADGRKFSQRYINTLANFYGNVLELLLQHQESNILLTLEELDVPDFQRI